MRYLSKSLVKWLKIRAQNELKRKKLVTKRKIKKRKSLSGCTEICAPANFDLVGKSRSKVIEFISSLRKLAQRCSSKILINMESVKIFHSGATILFYAELLKIKKMLPSIDIRGIPPRNNKAAQVLKQIGIAKLLKMSVSAKVKDHDVVNWKFATGQGADGKKYDEVLGQYDGVIADALSDNLYRGITEAMTNAHHHGYYEKRDDGFEFDPEYKPWWMFSQQKDGYLTVAFCDLGLGIPKTLPKKQKKWWNRAVRLGIDIQNDGKLIQGAVRNSNSRTRLLNRGKGLRQIVETAKLFDKGVVSIHSNRGMYLMKDRTESHFSYSDSIMGTVIQWQMPIVGVNHESV